MVSGQCHGLPTVYDVAVRGKRRHVVEVGGRVLTEAPNCAEGQQEACRSVKKTKPGDLRRSE